MSTYQITAVRTARPPGYQHEHITHVKLGTQDHAFPRSTIVADLRRWDGDRYYTLAGGVRADVILAHCPTCSASDYITTAPDWTTTNNLLSLRRF